MKKFTSIKNKIANHKVEIVLGAALGVVVGCTYLYTSKNLIHITSSDVERLNQATGYLVADMHGTRLMIVPIDLIKLN